MEKMIENRININFLDYHKFYLSVKKLRNENEIYIKVSGPYLPRIMFEIGVNSKGCSRTYNNLMTYNGNIIKEVKEKWEQVINEDIEYRIIENAFKNIPKLKESAYQKYMQFKLLHSRTAVNKKLHTMKLIYSNECLICQEATETIKHAFLECSSVRQLWLQIENWVKSKTNRTIKLSNLDKIFGRQNNEFLSENIITCAKMVIFNNRKNGENHNIGDVKKALYKQLRIEEYQSSLIVEEETFLKIWQPVYDELCTNYS